MINIVDIILDMRSLCNNILANHVALSPTGSFARIYTVAGVIAGVVVISLAVVVLTVVGCFVKSRRRKKMRVWQQSDPLRFESHVQGLFILVCNFI